MPKIKKVLRVKISNTYNTQIIPPLNVIILFLPLFLILGTNNFMKPLHSRENPYK